MVCPISCSYCRRPWLPPKAQIVSSRIQHSAYCGAPSLISMCSREGCNGVMFTLWGPLAQILLHEIVTLTGQHAQYNQLQSGFVPSYDLSTNSSDITTRHDCCCTTTPISDEYQMSIDAKCWTLTLVFVTDCTHCRSRTMH